MSADITKKLKALASVTPRTEWKKSNREFLMSRMKNSLAENPSSEKWAFKLPKIIFPFKVFRLVARPALAVVSVVALILGSGLSVSASQLALPGDPLYGLKLVSEKVQVALTFDKNEETKMHVELAGKRIDEIKRIRDNSDSPQNKAQKINVAMDGFQQEISTVQNNLATIKNDLPAAATVEVAQIVDDKTAEYQKDLTAATTDELPAGDNSNEKINQGIDLTETTSDQALAVIIDSQNQVSAAVEQAEDITQKVGDKVSLAEAKVANVEGQLKSLPQPTDEVSTSAAEAQQTIDQAKELLTEAHTALDQNNLSDALSKATESKELARQVEHIVSDATLAAANSEPVPCEDCVIVPDANTNTNVDTTANTADNTVKTVKPLRGAGKGCRARSAS